MNIESMISEYENERTSLIMALHLTDKNDVERRMEIAKQLDEIDELIEELKEEEKIKNSKYRN